MESAVKRARWSALLLRGLLGALAGLWATSALASEAELKIPDLGSATFMARQFYRLARYLSAINTAAALSISSFVIRPLEPLARAALRTRSASTDV